MATTAGTALPARGEARWFRRPAYLAATRVWHETLTVRGASFQAMLRLCDDGGCVVTLPALPQLMTRPASRHQARSKTHALVEGYLRTLRACERAAARRAGEQPRGLPRAA